MAARTGWQRRGIAGKPSPRNRSSQAGRANERIAFGAAPAILTAGAFRTSGEILDVLPGDAARARAARDRPFAGLGAELLRRMVEPVALGIAVDHREVGLLVAGVEAEPQAEPVGERDLLLDRLARIDRGRALVLDHVARQQMAAVGGGVEHDIVGPPLDAAFEHGLQRFVARVLLVEGQIVAEQQEAPRAPGAAATEGAAGSVMSSRWISMRTRARGVSALIAACVALTSELLPMPRAPHSSTLLAGSPAAKRRVLSSRMSRTRSIPCSRSSSTRFTLATGSSQSPSACQTKASAASRSRAAAAAAPAARARRRCAAARARAGRSIMRNARSIGGRTGADPELERARVNPRKAVEPTIRR